ncbi:MAG TPA: Npt1/Npt2 family nucleotide transporter [Bryobacteraceae bacterium]|nr:Npt1/Npt2 family nucleotide transporter [Bryobacteraceae bacterium]
MFDIRPGEHRRTWAMFFYLMFVLFAYYILKPVSRGMFLTKFDVDKLPQLYILIAAFGGALAYLYSRAAVKSSLQTAVFWTMFLSVTSLVAIWWAIHLPWMVYVLNIWVGLFSIILVSQGWLVASNLFDAREAKRLYPLLGMSMVLGAAFGGEFTNRTALLVGTRNLLLASAFMVVLSYLAFRVAISQAPTRVHEARAAEKKDTEFSFGEMMRDILRIRHLQVIVAILVVTYLVDTLVEYQFQAMARVGHTGDQLTAFFGQFYGLYLNLTEFIFQLFLTAAVVNRFGVGGTLQISPWSVALSSIATVVAPGVVSASAVRLTEASTRYTMNRTGMELLYMPLPLELRNRIKAFIDICVDRFSRGIGGVLLIFLTTGWLHLHVKGIAIVVMALCIPWIWLAHSARREYIATIRKRLESRRLDFQEVRINVTERATVQLLESTAYGEQARPAAYALTLLSQAPDYDIRPMLRKLAMSDSPEIRTAVFSAALERRDDAALENAVKIIRAVQSGESQDLPQSAVPYALALAPDRAKLARELLQDRNPALAIGAVEALRNQEDLAKQLLTREWMNGEEQSTEPARRRLAARAAGVLRDRTDVVWLASLLNEPKMRADAIDALAAYGPAICGALSDMLLDESMPIRVRRQIPRVLKAIPAQRSVDVLLSAIGQEDLSIRSAVLKALNRLRETSSGLNFENAFVQEQILKEARYYYELYAAMAPFKGEQARLLTRSIEYRLKGTLERLFRLLGLRYPPKEIYNAYRAVSDENAEDHTAALEFLDTTLERNLKRILIPLLDAPETRLERGRELFGLAPMTAEQAIRDLLHSHDPWLAPCAIATAAELKLRSLAPEIAEAAGRGESEVSEVAKSAGAMLAA